MFKLYYNIFFKLYLETVSSQLKKNGFDLIRSYNLLKNQSMRVQENKKLISNQITIKIYNIKLKNQSPENSQFNF